MNELITEHSPDIISGTGRNLNADYLTAEIFRSDFYVCRKERPATRGGGAFIVIHSNYLATHETSLESACEVIWMKMNIQRTKTLQIGCRYYRPTDNNSDNVYEPGNSMDKIPKRVS